MLRVRRHGPVTEFRMSRTLVGRPLYWVSVYHVDGLLIDTGCAHTAPELAAVLRAVPVHDVVVTHHHEDHAGGAPYLWRALGLPPRVHRAGVEALRRPPQRLPFYRSLVWGVPGPCEPAQLGDEVRTPNHAFCVLHAPGHSADQVVLFEPSARWLFSADLYLGRQVKFLRHDERLGDALASLRRIAALPIGRLFCGHAGVVDDGRRALQAKLAFWEDVCARVSDLHAAGLGPGAITRRVLGREGSFRWVTGGQFSKRHLVDEALRLSGVLASAAASSGLGPATP